MKFDVVIMNPPYQTLSSHSNKTTKQIWPKFVKLAFDITKENGIISAIHPAGWRNIDGEYLPTKKLIQSKTIKYLNINNVNAAKKTFGPDVNMRFDWYIINNVDYVAGSETEIKDENGHIEYFDIGGMDIIPNYNITNGFNIFGDENDDVVDFIHSYSLYFTYKPWMSKIKNDAFKYPCIENVGVNGDLTKVYYSTTNEKGHFGIPKVIFGRFGSGVYIDYNGEYGMCQDCYAISAPKDDLESIKKALQSKGFIEFMGSVCFGGITATIFPIKMMKLLKKDFWKEFV